MHVNNPVPHSIPLFQSHVNTSEESSPAIRDTHLQLAYCWNLESGVGIKSCCICSCTIIMSLYRNGEKTSRPAFAELVQALSSPVTDLLSWTEEDTRVHPQAVVLGAHLEAGKDLYPELQKKYSHT